MYICKNANWYIGIILASLSILTWNDHEDDICMNESCCEHGVAWIDNLVFSSFFFFFWYGYNLYICSRWKGVNRWYKPLDWVKIERKRHDKVVFDLVCVWYKIFARLCKKMSYTAFSYMSSHSLLHNCAKFEIHGLLLYEL